MTNQDHSADKTGAREADSTETEQYVAPARIEIPSEAWRRACDRWHTARKQGNEDAELMDFVQSEVVLDTQYVIPKDESNREIVVGEQQQPTVHTSRWEKAGQKLLAQLVTASRDEVTTALDQIEGKVESDQDLHATDVEFLRHALQEAEFLADQLAIVTGTDCTSGS